MNFCGGAVTLDEYLSVLRESRAIDEAAAREQEGRLEAAISKDTPASLYVMQQTTGSCLVKIGISSNPKNRLTQIQSAAGCELVLLHTHVFKKRSLARKVEVFIHQRLDEHRTHGEWFVGLDDQMWESAIESALRKYTKTGDQ